MPVPTWLLRGLLLDLLFRQIWAFVAHILRKVHPKKCVTTRYVWLSGTSRIQMYRAKNVQPCPKGAHVRHMEKAHKKAKKEIKKKNKQQNIRKHLCLGKLRFMHYTQIQIFKTLGWKNSLQCSHIPL